MKPWQENHTGPFALSCVIIILLLTACVATSTNSTSEATLSCTNIEDWLAWSIATENFKSGDTINGPAVLLPADEKRVLDLTYAVDVTPLLDHAFGVVIHS